MEKNMVFGRFIGKVLPKVAVANSASLTRTLSKVSTADSVTARCSAATTRNALERISTFVNSEGNLQRGSIVIKNRTDALLPNMTHTDFYRMGDDGTLTLLKSKSIMRTPDFTTLAKSSWDGSYRSVQGRVIDRNNIYYNADGSINRYLDDHKVFYRSDLLYKNMHYNFGENPLMNGKNVSVYQDFVQNKGHLEVDYGFMGTKPIETTNYTSANIPKSEVDRIIANG